MSLPAQQAFRLSPVKLQTGHIQRLVKVKGLPYTAEVWSSKTEGLQLGAQENAYVHATTDGVSFTYGVESGNGV